MVYNMEVEVSRGKNFILTPLPFPKRRLVPDPVSGTAHAFVGMVKREKDNQFGEGEVKERGLCHLSQYLSPTH
jgi:hypothetical protein